MADTTVPAGFPNVEVPFTDTRNGYLTRDGRYLLQAVWNRTGGNQGAATSNTFTDEKGSGGTPGFASGVDFTAGTTTQLTLSKSYGSAANLFITFDGTWQGADQFALNGRILTFTSAIPVGTTKVFVKGFFSG